MAKGRVQAPEIEGPVALRSPGVPGDTFTGAPQAPINTDLTRLADALSGFNSAISKWGTQAAADERKRRAAEEAAAVEGRLAQMSPQDVLNYRKSPEYLPVLDPHARGVEASVYGQSHAQVIQQQIDAQIRANEIKLDDPNFNAVGLLQGHARGAVDDINQRYANDPLAHKLAMEGFRKTYDGFYRTYAEQAMKARSDAIMATNMGAARRFFDAALTAGTAANKSPEEIAQTWSQVSAELGPRGSANVPYKAMKGIKLDLLENAAADPQKVVKVEGILRAEQFDADGKTKLPSLWDDQSDEVVERVRKIRQTAKNTLAKNWTDNYNTQLEDAAFEAYRRQDGSAAAIQPRRERNPVSGEFDTVGENAQTNAAKRYFTWSQADAASGRDPNIVLDREIRVAQHANIPIPHVKQMLDDVTNRVVDGSLSSDFNGRQQVISAYQTWRGMVTHSRPWSETKMELAKSTKEFFNAMDVATGPMKLDADQAVDFAAGIARNPLAKNEPDLLQRKLNEINAQVAKLPSDASFMSRVFGNSTPYNAGFVTNQVSEVARMLAKSGQLDTDTAIKLAKDFVAKNTFQVNGSAVASVPSMSADAARKFMMAKIDELYPTIKERFDYKDLKKADIAIYDKGDGTYGLRDKRTSLDIRIPTRTPDGVEWRGDITIQPRELEDMKTNAERLSVEQMKSDNAINSMQALRDAHDALERRERGLEKSSLGGAFYAAQKRAIEEQRAKLPPRPEPPVGEDPNWIMHPPKAADVRAKRRALREEQERHK